MLKEILIWLAIASGVGGALWWQHHELKVKDAQLVQMQSNILQMQSQVAGLTEARKADAKTAQAYAGRVSVVQKKNAELSRHILELQNASKSNADFLSLPIPDGLRDTINAYIGATAAAANQTPVSAAASAANGR